jgi:hypothetical protein
MTFDEGHDDVVIGLYYQKWGNNESFLSLLQNVGIVP